MNRRSIRKKVLLKREVKPTLTPLHPLKNQYTVMSKIFLPYQKSYFQGIAVHA